MLNVRFGRATELDAPAIVALRTSSAERLTAEFGRGHWSSIPGEPGILRAIRGACVLVAREGDTAVAALTLATRKPWSLNRDYFQPARRPLYLIDMAVAADHQRRGIGRQLVAEAVEVARQWPADAIWLDAYDAPAGAGEFYRRCGFREVGRVAYRGVPLTYFELRL